MVQHWIIIYKNNNFENSSRYNIWGIKSTTNAGKCFIKNVEKNDIKFIQSFFIYGSTLDYYL